LKFDADRRTGVLCAVMENMGHHSMRRAALLIGCALMLAAGVVLLAGEMLSRPASTRVVGQPPGDLGAVSVRLPVSPTASVAGWFSRGTGRGAVLLLHGVRADRTQMLGRARFLRDAGYSVMLIDLPGHGESSGDRIGFGAREAAGVTAALQYVRQQLPADRVGVIGVSLGAAALVLARPMPPPDAVVVESMYATLSEAVSNRLVLRLGPGGQVLAPLLLWQVPLRLGVSVDDLRPVAAMSSLAAPLLVASGTDDRHTLWPETERIFAAAQQPKALWAVSGAAHVDLHLHDAAAYRTRILGFLEEHLRRPD